jgi:hypothetical protein
MYKPGNRVQTGAKMANSNAKVMLIGWIQSHRSTSPNLPLRPPCQRGIAKFRPGVFEYGFARANLPFVEVQLAHNLHGTCAQSHRLAHDDTFRNTLDKIGATKTTGVKEVVGSLLE